jgi:hypothetical protein
MIFMSRLLRAKTAPPSLIWRTIIAQSSVRYLLPASDDQMRGALQVATAAFGDIYWQFVKIR